MKRTEQPFDMAKTPAGVVPLPYDNRFLTDGREIDLVGDPAVDPLKPAELVYKKREGGTYIYSNNPEMLRAKDLGQALLRTKDLTGDVEFTYEHSNHSGQPAYIGYQLKNEGKEDAEVLVTNIGIQVDGEWLGQRSWSDFYNVKFDLPTYYFVDGKEYFGYVGQDFLDYTPRVFQPTTYRIPAGEYIYVLGGTSADAYANTNVGDTADKVVEVGRCSNGAVKFRVLTGKVTGTVYFYADAEQVKAEPAEQGYVVNRDEIFFGGQYKGVDPHLGMIEADISWTVNDRTMCGTLPVSFTNYYDDHIAEYPKTPYMAYQSTPHRQHLIRWLTSLNPQNAHEAVGTDMMIFHCITEDGTPVVIDNEHADGAGDPANTGNWMVQCNHNFTLVNQGEKERTFRIYTDGALAGALFVLVRNEAGDVLNTRCTISPICYPVSELPKDADPSRYENDNGLCFPIMPDGRSYRLHRPEEALMATVKVAPHSYERITIDFNILGNSCGSAWHWVTLDEE
ncbi:MAG: hypothetical protein IJU16_04710 [Clostridia bacterium]|nr:hypothetical protein [Clostridia bacterium]